MNRSNWEVREGREAGKSRLILCLVVDSRDGLLRVGYLSSIYTLFGDAESKSVYLVSSQ